MAQYSTRVISAMNVHEIIEAVGVDALMDEVMTDLEAELKSLRSKKAEAPPRTGFHYEHPDRGLLEWMPVYDGATKATIKVVGYHPDNPARHHVPTILSSVSRFDTTTGHLVGLADATFLTALRTGAMTGLATAALAPSHSSVVGMIGLGAQAVTQLHAISRRFDVRTVLIADLASDRVDSFPERISGFGGDSLEILPASLEDLVAGCDILSTSTSVGVGKGPVFQDTEHQPWLHINAVGSDFPGKFELPLELLRRSFVVADFLPQAHMEGECQRLDDGHSAISIVELLEQPELAAEVRERTTVFDSTGWALTDQVAMDLLMRHADQLGTYTEIDLESVAGDPFAPYPTSAVREVVA